MAAIKNYSGLDMQKNSIIAPRIDPQASAPGSPVTGQLFYDTTANAMKYWNGTAWVIMDVALVADGYIPMAALATNPLARANHTGTQLAATISDFDTQVRTSRLDQMANPTGSVSMNSQKITNLLDPTNPQDAATKAYADAAAAGIDAKASCRVATTANITLSGTQTIDGVSVIAGDRVLVKNQTTASANGIYVCAAGSWSRATDCDSSAEYTSQAFVFIEEGTTLGGSAWKVSTTGSITVGTTSVTWAQFAAGGTYTNGNGLDLSGSQFSVKLDSSSGLVVSGTGLKVDNAVVVRKYAADIGNGSSTSITVTHSLGTQDVIVQVYRKASPYDQIGVDIRNTSTSAVTINFASAPASAEYRCVVHA